MSEHRRLWAVRVVLLIGICFSAIVYVDHTESMPFYSEPRLMIRFVDYPEKVAPEELELYSNPGVQRLLDSERRYSRKVNADTAGIVAIIYSCAFAVSFVPARRTSGPTSPVK